MNEKEKIAKQLHDRIKIETDSKESINAQIQAIQFLLKNDPDKLNEMVKEIEDA